MLNTQSVSGTVAMVFLFPSNDSAAVYNDACGSCGVIIQTSQILVLP